MLIIDRIVEEVAVIEDSLQYRKFNMPLSRLPEGAKEGDVLVETPEGFQVDAEETIARRAKLSALFSRLKRYD